MRKACRQCSLACRSRLFYTTNRPRHETRQTVHPKLYMHPCSQLPAVLRFLAAHTYTALLPPGELPLPGSHARPHSELLYGERAVHTPLLGLPDGQVPAQADIHTVLFHVCLHVPRLHAGSHPGVVHLAPSTPWCGVWQRHRRRQHALRRHNAKQQARRRAGILWPDQQHGHGPGPNDGPVHAQPHQLHGHFPHSHDSKLVRTDVRMRRQGTHAGVYAQAHGG